QRLDQVLEDFGVYKIVCEGQPFDPRRMSAVDREPTGDVPEGTVLEVYRSGYEWNGEVFRAPHVKVSCAPSSALSTKDTRSAPGKDYEGGHRWNRFGDHELGDNRVRRRTGPGSGSWRNAHAPVMCRFLFHRGAACG